MPKKPTIALILAFLILQCLLLGGESKACGFEQRPSTQRNMRAILYSSSTLKGQSEEATSSGTFFEDFESGVNGWRRDTSELGRTLRFETVSKPNPVYEKKTSLVLSGKDVKPKQSSLVKWIYDLSDREIKVRPDLKLSFAWLFPEKRFSYIGLYILFSDGRGGHYASYFYGSSSNDTKNYMYQYTEPQNSWRMHERNIYDDYRKAFGALKTEVQVMAVGLMLADTYATGSEQTAYYDSISISPEINSPKKFALKIEPTLSRARVGETVVFAISVMAIGDYRGEISMNVTGVPTHIVTSLSEISGDPPFNSNLIVEVGTGIKPGIYSILITASDKKESESDNVTIAVMQEVRFLFEADPPNQIVSLGESISFQLSLRTRDAYNLVPINLSVSGLPSNITYEIDPASITLSTGTPAESRLKIDTTPFTQPGNYKLEITARDESYGSKDSVMVTLVVSGASFTITMTLDKPTYSQGGGVHLYGSVRDLESLPAQAGSVSIQILNPSGSTVHVASTMTNRFGQYADNFTLTSEAAVGTYTIFVTVTVPGYQDSYNQATFTVGESLTPSIKIVAVYLTDSAGLNISSFHPSQTVVVRVAVQNGGAELKNGMIWVEVNNPDGIPLPPVFVETTIARGGTVTVGVITALAEGALPGYYMANSYVSDRMIAQGGKFLANSETIFQVS
jgi:PKD repeat protein